MASYSKSLERNLKMIGSKDPVNSGDMEDMEVDMEDIKEENMEEMEECNDNNVGSEAVSCPVCGKWIKKSIFAHLGGSKHCKKNISPEDLLKFENIRTLKRKMDNRSKAAKFRRLNPEKARETVAKIRRLNPEKARKQTREGVAKTRRLNPEKARKQTREGVAKLRRVDGEEDRLYNFRVATLFGPIFNCISCHEKKFHHSVQNFNEKIIMKVEKKIALEKCIYNFDLTSGPVMKGDDSPRKWICKTCLNSYLLKGKLPPNSVMNGLKIDMTNKERKERGLDLTEFEGSLVARHLMFQKIFMLPGSRWAGVKDKQILIPVSNDKIQKFLGQLPRTPTEAGLLGVNLKRKLEYKGSHKCQLIDPQKLFKFIATCKAAGHPLYQDVSTEEDYVEKCKKSEADYMLVYGNEDNSSDLDSADVSEESRQGDDEDEDWETCEEDENDDYDEEVEEDEEYDVYEDEKVSNFMDKLDKQLEAMRSATVILDDSKASEVQQHQAKEDEDSDDSGDYSDEEIFNSKEEFWNHVYLKNSIYVSRNLINILDEFPENENINRILTDAFTVMTGTFEHNLVALWHILFIIMHDHKAEVDPVESLEDLEIEEKNLRNEFIERMGVDPIDPEKPFEIDQDTLEEGQLRWWPPRPFSKNWIHFMISEKAISENWGSLFTDYQTTK